MANYRVLTYLCVDGSAAYVETNIWTHPSGVLPHQWYVLSAGIAPGHTQFKAVLKWLTSTTKKTRALLRIADVKDAQVGSQARHFDMTPAD